MRTLHATRTLVINRRWTYIVALEWKWQDLWVGIFVRSSRPTINTTAEVIDYELWLCLVPCLPIHLHLRNWRWPPSAPPASHAG